ncbi:MAG TPA: glycosyltransferase 87 family protein [Candidatus Limnocylindria bacterium]|nr:glycosyltransferase 87 family protein [Candidatus Limnocylindria bacterium]
MDPAARDRLLRLAGVLLIAFAASAIGMLAAQRGLGRDYASYDLSAYVAAADRFRHGEPLYPQLDAASFRLGDQGLFRYPPPVALLFLPALGAPFPVVSALWGIALTMLAVAVALALARAVAPARRPLAVGLTLGAFPLQWELANGNLTLVTLALALVAWRLRAAVWWAAIPLAVASGLKLLVAPALLAVALSGRRRIGLATCGLSLAAVVVSWPVLGAAWRDWTVLTLQLSQGPQTAGYNVVPEALRGGAGRVALAAIALAVLVACGALARARRVDERLALAAALAAGPFVSAFVFYPYVLFLLPLAVLLVLGDTPPWARVAGIAAWVLADLQALDPLTAYPSALLATALGVGAVFAVARMPGGRPRS